MRPRTYSQPSLGTIGTGTIATAETSRTSRMQIPKDESNQRQRGEFLWQGKYAPIISALLMMPWNPAWQGIILLSVVYGYIVHLLNMYVLEENLGWDLLDNSLLIVDFLYFIDITTHFVHAFWPLVRLHMRAYRRNKFALAFDAISLVPLWMIASRNPKLEILVALNRWECIIRIYRLVVFFSEINEAMHRSRKLLYCIEHVVLTLLAIHAGTCFWYYSHQPKHSKDGQRIGYPLHFGSQLLKFNSYRASWYYTSCRILNVIYGDSFPVNSGDKWLTAFFMLSGFVFVRYRFIGTVAWDLIVENNRLLTFVDRYHHMLRYLKFHRAPEWLVQQASRYKLELWRMKDGILTCDHLQTLPLPLQMELIFDINVGNFHNTLLFRNIGEAFMRHISLLMRHEIFLEGQLIWNQGVVKNGMICIKRGVIELLSDEDDESPMIAFTEGTVLGEISLFYSIPAKVSVKAATYVELQLLRRTDFMRAIADQANMLQQIRYAIHLRLNKSKKQQTAIEKYERDDSRLLRTRYRPMKVLKDHLDGIEDEDNAFSDDSHMYYRDENNERQPKFTAEYLELYKISNKVTTINSPRICIRSTFPWILEPETNFTIMIDIAHFIMVLYVCFVSPFVAILQDERDKIEEVITTVVKTGLMLQIYVQLTTAVVEKNERKETVREIAEVKMSSIGFYLDILSVFPMYIFSDTIDSTRETIAGQVALMFPILQIWHIWSYVLHWQNSFYSNPKLLCLLKYLLIFTIVSYWSGCFLYLNACPRRLCRENSWMAQLIYWETKVLVVNEAKHEHTIVSSYYFGASTIAGTGTADLTPGVGDLSLVFVLLILGTYLSCFYTAKLCSIYMLLNQRKQKFKESMKELFYFLTVNHVSGKIKARVKKFFCVQWYYNNGVTTEELFNDMSTNIQQEVLSIEMVETLMYCPLFQDVNRDFLQTVAANTRTVVLPDNEVVQHAADISRDMYVLKKGHCKLLDHHGKTVSFEGPGSQFGVLEMLYGLPKVYTVLTTTNCILHHIEYSALMQCLSTFPEVYSPISVVLDDEDVIARAALFEEAKPLTGKFDTKTNRIAVRYIVLYEALHCRDEDENNPQVGVHINYQEIKESFVVLTGPEERAQYVKVFQRLGVMRFVRYVIVPGCITPHGIFLKVWCAFRFTLAIFYVFTVPYNIATRQSNFGGNDDFMDIFLYLDIVVMAYVAYYDERSLLVTHPLLTISYYLKHAFVLDIISIFPLEQVLHVINRQINMDLYRLNRLLQVSRIVGAFNYCEGNIMRVNQLVVLCKYLPVAVTTVNLGTAMIFMNSCRVYIKPDTYFIMANCTRGLVTNSNKYDIKYAMFEYINTFYWIFEILLGCGCTTVSMSSSSDVWYVILLAIIGSLYFGFMYGYIASTRSTAASALLDHAEKTKDLANFLYQNNVEFMLTMKTLKYFEYVWKRTNGSNPQQICRRLNSALMEDTLVFMYERTLREVPLFGNVDRSFIRVITQHLTEMYFLKGETVIQCRDIQPYIYIIYRGKVDVLSSYNEMITCMGPGGMFGNFTGQPISCSEVSIYASRSLDLLVIPSQTFFNLVKYYPKIQEPLNKAFERSKDYILPITMDITEDLSEADDSTDLDFSGDSAIDNRSGSNGFDGIGALAGQLSTRSSQSNLSQAKSGASILTYQTYNVHNILRPGSRMFQLFGYTSCFVTTFNYIFVLYGLVTNNQCNIMIWIHGLCDIFFYVKTYFLMHQGYSNKHGDIVLNFYKCRQRYFRHKFRFWSDVVVNFPLDVFSLCFSEPLKYIHYMRINKLLRVKYLWQFYRRTAAELTNNLTTLQTVMTFSVVILLIHTFTCVWLLVLTATQPISIVRTLKTHILDDEPTQRRWDYTTSLYVMVAELTSTGGDEFSINDIYSMSILGIALICGKMLAAVVIATAMQVAYSAQHALNKYETSTLQLIDVLKNQGLSNYQMNKFWVYVQQLWVTERGRQLPALIAQTPYVRRCDLMSAMFGHHLRNCYLFSDTGEPFLRQLTVVLDYTIFFPGNYIVVAGDTEARMYWVESGTVSVVSVRTDLTETTHELLGPGDVFGILQGLNRGLAHCFSYRAETKVSILTLSLDAWVHILPFFPEAQTMINERSEILFTQI